MAEKELDELSPQRPEQRGDAWWERAGKETGTIRKQAQARAAYWYREALPGLSGLPKDVVQNRLDSLTEQHATPAIVAHEKAAPAEIPLSEHTTWTVPYGWTEEVQKWKSVIKYSPGTGHSERKVPYMETVHRHSTKTIHATLVNYDPKTGTVVLKSIPDREKGEKEEVRSFRYSALGADDKKYLSTVKGQFLKQ